MSLKRKIKHCSARKQTSTTIVVLTTVAACYTLFNEIFEPPKTSELENLNCSYPNADLSKKYEDYLSVTSVLERTENCAEYIKVIHPEALAPTTEAERDFPLAFAYTVHKDIGILEMFLALYLRPMDSHCIHVDAKASHEMHHAVERIVKCYSEQFPKADVFLPRKSIPVFWGYGGSIMEADMICYKELKNRGRRWEMVANIAGTELPFVSHQKFREVLSRAGGNVMEIQRNRNKDRQRNFYEMKGAGPNQSLRMVRKPNYLHPGPPCGIKILKGIKNGAFTRQFVDFALGNRFAQDLYGWIYDTGHPCEHFMATLATLSTSPHSSSPETLNVFQSFHAIVRREKETGVWENRRSPPSKCYRQHEYRTGLAAVTGNSSSSSNSSSNNSSLTSRCRLVKEECNFNINHETEGVFRRVPESLTNRKWTQGICYRASLWYYKGCAGRNIRDICNLGLEDMAVAKQKRCLIGNKFSTSVDAVAVMCQVREIRELTRYYVPGVVQNNVK